MPNPPLTKALRVTHLYFGVFITPALLFFALTGALQTFGLHESNRDHPDYKPARWIAVLAQIHKKQTDVIPVRKPQTPAPAAAAPTVDGSGDRPHKKPEAGAAAPVIQAAVPAPATPAAAKRNPLPMRIFFLIVCIGLFVSTATGLYMSYVYTRNKLLVSLTLLAGTVLPPLLLLF